METNHYICISQGQLKPSNDHIKENPFEHKTATKIEIGRKPVESKSWHIRRFKRKVHTQKDSNRVPSRKYLNIIRNPAHRISITKLRLAVNSLRIQTQKYKKKGSLIPVESRTCLICTENYIEDEKDIFT